MKPLLPNILKNNSGYVLIAVTMIGLIMAVIFGYILPQLHTGQMIRGITELNEQRALEAARTGVNAVKLGIKDTDNFMDLMGYPISGVTIPDTFAIEGNYAHLFTSGVSVTVSYSTGNDALYTVSGATNFESGVSRTEISFVETFSDTTIDGIINRNRGILWAINELTSGVSPYDSYTNSDGEEMFVSGVSGMDVSNASYPDDKGKIQIAVLVTRSGVTYFPTDANSTDGNYKNDGLYFYNAAISGATPWQSEDNGAGITWSNYDIGTEPRYFDYDGGGNASNSDVKYWYQNNTWQVSIGNSGTYRGQDGSSNELWNLERDFSSGVTVPYQGKDNDADGDIDDNDKVEVVIFVRSTGITAASGPQLVNDVNPNLPNPRRQVIEAGFILEDKQ